MGSSLTSDNERRVIHVKDVSQGGRYETINRILGGFWEKNPERDVSQKICGSGTYLFGCLEDVHYFADKLDGLNIPFSLHPVRDYPGIGRNGAEFGRDILPLDGN